MERFQKFILLPLILTASLPGLGFCYSIIHGPSNATVLAGSEARFNCTVSEGWVILIWLSNGNPVLTVINSQGAVETSDRFTSQNYTSSNGFTSELIIHKTQMSDSGKIECSIQQTSESGFAFLSVQGSTYQNEIRKVSAGKSKDGDLENRQRHGSENQGYIPEELWNSEQSPGIASLPPVSSKFTVPAADLHISSSQKVGPQRCTNYLISPKKIRNVTLV